MLYLYDLYKVGRICIYVEKEPKLKLWAFIELKQIEIFAPNLNLSMFVNPGMIWLMLTVTHLKEKTS